MGLTDNEALCRLSALTAAQIAGLDVLAGRTPGEVAAFGDAVEAVWAGHVQAVQDAKATVRDAQQAYTAACDRHAEVVGPLRRLMATGRCTDQQVDAVEAAEATVAAAYAARAAAVDGLEVARARFKAGVTADQLGDVWKGY